MLYFVYRGLAISHNVNGERWSSYGYKKERAEVGEINLPERADVTFMYIRCEETNSPVELEQGRLTRYDKSADLTLCRFRGGMMMGDNNTGKWIKYGCMNY